MKKLLLMSILCLIGCTAFGQTTQKICTPYAPCDPGQTCDYVLFGTGAYGFCRTNAPACNGVGPQPTTCADGSPCINGVCGSSSSPRTEGQGFAAAGMSHVQAEPTQLICEGDPAPPGGCGYYTTNGEWVFTKCIHVGCSVDPNNCGGIGNICPVSQVCDDGMCHPPLITEFKLKPIRLKLPSA